MKTYIAAAALAAFVASFAAVSHAQQLNTPITQPVINVTASATSALPNDRMHAWLRVEVDNSDPVAAANE